MTLQQLTEKNIISELASVGVVVESVWDLVNRPNNYEEAIPLLVESLNKNYEPRTLEGIVRSLATKQSQGLANKALLDLFHKVPPNEESLRWTIGSTIEAIIQPEDEQKVIEIVKNKNNKTTRQMFVLALGKIRSKAVEEAMQELVDDLDVIKQVQVVLKKFERYGLN